MARSQLEHGSRLKLQLDSLGVEAEPWTSSPRASIYVYDLEALKLQHENHDAESEVIPCCNETVILSKAFLNCQPWHLNRLRVRKWRDHQRQGHAILQPAAQARRGLDPLPHCGLMSSVLGCGQEALVLPAAQRVRFPHKATLALF